MFGWRLYKSNQQLRVAKGNAEASASQARHRLAEFYREQGRRELLAHRPLPAAVYLSQAYQEGDTGPILCFLLAQAIQPLDAKLTSLDGHTGAVQSAAFSPDGTRVVTVSDDGTAKVWDMHLETRTPPEIAALVRCRAPWRLEAGVLLPSTPDPTVCPRRASQR